MSQRPPARPGGREPPFPELLAPRRGRRGHTGAAALSTGTPPFGVWQDSALVAGTAWDDQIVEAIRTSETLLLLMTEDSVRPNSKGWRLP